jgi:RNA polymerase sigma factor (sigma-70 family)
MATTDEGRLVIAARHGDQRAFGQLFDAWFDRVHDLSRRIVHDPGIASEVAQDALLKAWTKLDTLEDPDAFGGWLLRIARNGSLNRLEKERRAVATDDEVLTAHRDKTVTADDPFEQLDDAGRVALVWEAAAALGERDLSVLDLHLRHGMTPKELAGELGCTPNNAHQVMFTLRKRLGGAIKAFVLWRAGRPTCPELRNVLAEADITRFDATTMKVIDAHATRCDDCAEQRTERVAPAALFATAPMVAAPLAVRSRAAASLSDAGVPMEGSMSFGAHQPGGSGPGTATPDTSDLMGGFGPNPVASVGGAVGAEASGDDDAEAGTGAAPEPNGTLERRRALLVGTAALLLIAAIALWPSGDDDDQELVTSATTTALVTSSTAARASTTSTNTESTTVLTMVPVPRPDDATTGTVAGGGTSIPSVGSTGGGSGGGAGAGGGGGSGSGTTTSIGTVPQQETTQPPPAPTIDSFTAVAEGYCTSKPNWAAWKLTWRTSNATVVTTQKLGQSPVERSVDGTVTHCTKGNTSFTLRASNLEGGAGGATQVIDAPFPYPVL